MSEDGTANEKFVRQINALMDRAQHPKTTPEEREACLQKADAIRLKYAIDRATLAMAKDGGNGKPKVVRQNWPMPVGTHGSLLEQLMRDVARHCRLKSVSAYLKSEDAGRGYIKQVLAVMGMSEDVEFASSLWTLVYREFVDKLNPRWESWRTFDANVKAFKDAGFTWLEITKTAVKAGAMDAMDDGGRALRAYRRECRRLGVPPLARQSRHEAYRNSYASAFVRTMQDRLYEMQEKSEQATKSEDQGANEKAALALRSEDDVILEEFYKEFPFMRPASEEELAKWRAERERMEAEERAKWEALPEQERIKRLRQQARENERMQKAYEARQRRGYDANGWVAGSKAAQNVDLSVGRNRVGRNKKELEG